MRLERQQKHTRLVSPALSLITFKAAILWWLLLKCSAVGIGFNGAETNCRIAQILGFLLKNSYNTDIYFLPTTIICSLSTLNSLGGLLCQPHTLRKWSIDEEMVEVVSKETVVLLPWEIGKQELCLSTDHEAFVDH